jgi:hypothetical protein
MIMFKNLPSKILATTTLQNIQNMVKHDKLDDGQLSCIYRHTDQPTEQARCKSSTDSTVDGATLAARRIQ